MRTFRLNKLVRDNLLDLMQTAGQTVKYRVLDDAEFLQALQDKLHEEIAELDVAKPDALKELADIQEVIDALVKQFGETPEDFKRIQTARAAKQGGLAKKNILKQLLWTMMIPGLNITPRSQNDSQKLNNPI